MNPTLSLLRVSTLSIALLSASIVVAEAGEPAGAGSVAATSFEGRYQSAPTEAEKAARQKSVDTTVDEFFAITRPIARRRLEAMTRIPAWLKVKQTSDKVTVEFEGRKAETCPLEGSAKGKDPEGNDAEFAARIQGDKLVQTITTEEGKRTNTIKRQADGSLKVTVEIESKKFETPIRYTLSYASSK